jgi:hypothetical protein
VVEIALAIWQTGSYVTRVGAGATDDLAALRRAADQAARLLGARALVDVSRPYDSGGCTAAVTFADPDGRGLRRAQDGLGRLRRSVRSEQQAAAR